MTKDNWIKALAEQFMGDINPDTYKLLESFISQVEKDARKEGYEEGWNNAVNMDEWETRLQDAIEKTNKRWRERIERQRLEMLVSEEMGNAVFRDLSKKQNELTNAIFDSLSDLLEDK